MEQERKIKTIIDCVNVGKVFQTPEENMRLSVI